MRTLILFSGTGSISSIIDGEKVSVDISDKYYTPTHKVDIMNWDYTYYPPGYRYGF